MDKKKIQFLFSGEIFKLPPFLTILDCLKDEFTLKVLCYETAVNFSKLQDRYQNDDIEFENVSERIIDRSFSNRVKGKLRRSLNVETTFHKKAKEVIGKSNYDKLWIIHENTLEEVKDLLHGHRFTISMYELNDARGQFLNNLKEAFKEAEEIVVCEPNRASIMRTWMQLKTTPTVVPNKPLQHPRQRNIQLKKDYGFDGKKIVLYQGHIQKSRNVDAFCKALSEMPDFMLVLMGSRTDYRDLLQQTYPNVKFIDFVNPPEHLYITSHAYIGVVKYDYVDLNSIFCAPNKTYEYAGFGIPMIANDIPGLVNSVGRFGAAVCIDTDNVNDIKNAIVEIDNNYQSYCESALRFYDDFDVRATLLKIANR